MANSLYQQMTQNQSSQNNQLKQILNMFKNSSNPMQMVQMLAAQNPRVSQMLNMLNSSGMSVKQLFMQQAQQMGVDPNQILNMLK